MSVSYWLDQKQQRKKISSDICIIGAGITGLSLAYWLAREDKNLKVTIIDKSEVGGGASGRNAGFVTCGSVEHFNRMVSKHGEDQALEIWRFCEINRERLKSEIIKDSQKALGFKQSGSFSLASTQAEMDELSQVAQLMLKNRIPVETLNSKDIKNRLGVQNFVGGIKYEQDAEIDPIALLQKIRSLLSYDILEHSQVHSVEKVGEQRRVHASHHIIDCTAVIYALNGYSQMMDPYFADKIYPTRGQIMAFAPVKKIMEGPCYANAYLDYFRQLPDGTLLIGGFRQLEADTEKGYSDHTTEVIQQALHDFVKKHLPKFSAQAITHRWSGVMGFSQDGEPMVGSMPTDEQIYFCGGYTGHGLGMAFNTAKTLVDLMFGRSIPNWLSAKRF
jgi:gamma-glutamylputrescine oxidase